MKHINTTFCYRGCKATKQCNTSPLQVVAFPPVVAHQPLDFTALVKAGGFLVNSGSGSKFNDDEFSDDEMVDPTAGPAVTSGAPNTNVNGNTITASSGIATTGTANGAATVTVTPATGLQRSQLQHATCVSCNHPGVLPEMT